MVNTLTLTYESKVTPAFISNYSQIPYGGYMHTMFNNTFEEVKKLARRWYDDVDGECCIVYAELNKETGKYKFSNYKEVCY